MFIITWFFVCTHFFAWGNRPARSVIELAEKVRIDLARPIGISDLLQAVVQRAEM
jgi:hypothetical protein